MPGSDLEVLTHVEGGEDAAALGNKPHPHLGDAVGRHAGDIDAFEPQLTAARRCEADDGAHQGRLAHAVAPQDRYYGATLSLEGDALQHVAVAVIGVDIAHL